MGRQGLVPIPALGQHRAVAKTEVDRSVEGQRVVGVIEQRMAADVTAVGEVDAAADGRFTRRFGAEQLPESARSEVSESSTSLQVSRIQMPPTSIIRAGELSTFTSCLINL
jgi:hypothetical protein